jgi:hypothetical protein
VIFDTFAAKLKIVPVVLCCFLPHIQTSHQHNLKVTIQVLTNNRILLIIFFDPAEIPVTLICVATWYWELLAYVKIIKLFLILTALHQTNRLQDADWKDGYS